MIVAVVLQVLAALFLLVARLIGRAGSTTGESRPVVARLREWGRGGPRIEARLLTLMAASGAASSVGMLAGVLPAGSAVFWANLFMTLAASIGVFVARAMGGKRAAP